ncbi:MAG: hypothetical protein AAF399_19520 [Bacteroidota bacterium]
MKSLLPYLFCPLLFLPLALFGQKGPEFSGQISVWGSYNPDQELNMFYGGRYLPELAYSVGKEDSQQVAIEISGNVFGNAFVRPFDTAATSASIRPYRAFVRYSTPQTELRVGLQKISFGSAAILRPLMWFDQIDPRDPLQITNGVWGVLGRHYFLNNANVWVWVLQGNDQPKGWESLGSNGSTPEFGGRFQYPVKQGEIALSAHRRVVNAEHLGLNIPTPDRVAENRIGLDGKWDLKVGLWFEASYTQKARPVGLLTNQLATNVGIDYTFGIGNGLNVRAEQLTFAFGETREDLFVGSTLVAGTLSYPFGMFATLSGVVYYDWTNEALFNFLNYQYQFPAFSLNVMGYWNPQNTQLIQQNEGANPFGGKGVQIMLVFNH